MYFQRKCRFCGKVFETKRYPNQFCSQSCYFKSKRAQRNAAKVNAIKQANPGLQPVIQDGYVRYRHTCAYCNNEFISVRPEASFCSKRCYQKQVRGLKADKAKEQRSQEIQERAEYYNERFRGKALKFMKVCPVCNREFVASKVTTVFCSSKCARTFRQNQANEERQRKVTTQTLELELSKAKTKSNDMLRPEEAAEYLRVDCTAVVNMVTEDAPKPGDRRLGFMARAIAKTNMTHEELAKALGRRRTAIHHWLNEVDDCMISQVYETAEALGMNVTIDIQPKGK